jgi:hypothetical protein
VARIIDFFSKYTTLVTGTYYSDWFDVTAFKTIKLEVYNAAICH